MTTENAAFDPIQVEKNESDLLIERGIEFSVPKKSLLKYFSKQAERKFVIRQPYIGVLDLICNEFLKIDFDETAIQDDPMSEVKRLPVRSVKVLANIVAIAVLDSRWKIKVFKGLLANYFLWRITPQKLVKIAEIIHHLCNFKDFIASTRLMSVTKTTTPNRVEKEKG